MICRIGYSKKGIWQYKVKISSCKAIIEEIEEALTNSQINSISIKKVSDKDEFS
jgi:hypothetical protein